MVMDITMSKMKNNLKWLVLSCQFYYVFYRILDESKINLQRVRVCFFVLLCIKWEVEQLYF